LGYILASKFHDTGPRSPMHGFRKMRKMFSDHVRCFKTRLVAYGLGMRHRMKHMKTSKKKKIHYGGNMNR
jgi:hypothetical protein